MRELKEKEKSLELNNQIVSMIKLGSKVEKEAGFELLFKKFKPLVFNFLNTALFSDRETAKDLMIEVFMKVHINIDSYSAEKAALSTWIYKISKNVLIDHFRSRANNETLSIDSLFDNAKNNDSDANVPPFQIADNNANDSSELLIREERVLELLNALNKVKREDYRKALTLFYFEEKSYKEISDEMNISNSSLKVLLHRAKISLRVILDRQGFLA